MASPVTSDEDEDLDDVPLSLPYAGSQSHLNNTGTVSLGSRPPALALNSRSAVPQSSFAAPGGMAVLRLAVDNNNEAPINPSPHPLNGSREMELSFNAMKSATPERYEEPLPSSRHPPPTMLGFRLTPPPATAATSHAQSPDLSIGARPAAHIQQQTEPSRSGAPVPPSTQPAHASPAAALQARSRINLPNASTSGRTPDVSVVPPGPSLPLVRTMKPPRLHLENPATASPVMSPMHAARATLGSSGLGRPSLTGNSIPSGMSLTDTPGQAANKRLFVSLLSPAFSVPFSSIAPAAAGPTAAAAASTTDSAASATAAPSTVPQQLSSLGRPPRTSTGGTPTSRSPTCAGTAAATLPCIPSVISSTLGIQPSAMQCFTLQEVPWEQLGAAGAAAGAVGGSAGTGAAAGSGASHVAVLVEGSSFNLASLEEMLRTNQQLLSTQETHAKTISSLQADYKAATSARQDHAVRTAQLEKDLEYALARARAAEAEAAELKVQLQRCDEQRMQLGATVAGLRAHFDQSGRGWFEAMAAAGAAGPGATAGAGAGGAQSSTSAGPAAQPGGALEAELRRMSLEVTGLPSPLAAAQAVHQQQQAVLQHQQQQT